MSLGLGAQTLACPVFLPELRLHRASLEVVTAAAAMVTTGNGHCAGSTVKVHLCLPAPLKTSSFI